MGILEIAELAPGHVVARWADNLWYFRIESNQPLGITRQVPRISVWCEPDEDEEGCRE